MRSLNGSTYHVSILKLFLLFHDLVFRDIRPSCTDTRVPVQPVRLAALRNQLMYSGFWDGIGRISWTLSTFIDRISAASLFEVDSTFSARRFEQKIILSFLFIRLTPMQLL